MIWAKIVNDEVMQLSDENPVGLWHPDAIAKNDIPGYWDEIPDYVHIGWRFRDNEWISGGQWHEEWVAANPPPPPGPPGGSIDAQMVKLTSTEVVYRFVSKAFGIFDSIGWSINGETSEEVREDMDIAMPFDMTFELSSVEKTIEAELTVTGPGGTVTVARDILIPATVTIP